MAVVAAEVVVAAGAVVVVSGAAVVVVAGAEVVVVSGAAAVQTDRVMVLESKVTSPFRASIRPSAIAPVCMAIDVNAMTVPKKEVVVPSVAELPTCQNTLQA